MNNHDFLLRVFARSVPALAIGASLLLVACGDKGGAGAPASGGAAAGAGAKVAAPPAPVVGVLEVRPQTIGVMTELPGRLEASRIAQVRARTAGVVQKRLFREGGDVKAGQSLFQIDNAPQMATLQSARASLAKAEANLGQTSALARRYKPLMQANAISKQEYDNALAAEKASRAEVLAAQAAVRTAQINVGYSQVLAPIGGRIGKAQVTEGALVGQGEATLLATIQQLDPLVVNFSQSASDMLRLRKALAGGKLEAAGGNPPVKVMLEDGSVYDKPGRLLFTDATVDATTGQVSFKAEIPNPQGLLLPGLFVKVQIEQSQAGNAILLPQQAVTRGGSGDTVLVANADGSYGPRKVQVGQAQGGQWLILGGLNPGDKVIVDGVMKLNPTVKTVQTTPWEPGKPAMGGKMAGMSETAGMAASAPQPAVSATANAAASTASASSAAAGNR